MTELERMLTEALKRQEEVFNQHRQTMATTSRSMDQRIAFLEAQSNEQAKALLGIEASMNALQDLLSELDDILRRLSHFSKTRIDTREVRDVNHLEGPSP